MYSAIYSGALCGVSAYLVSVEVDIARGLPGFSMVGSLGSEVRESRERVMVALKNVGIELPPCHREFIAGGREEGGHGFRSSHSRRRIGGNGGTAVRSCRGNAVSGRAGVGRGA